MADKTSDAADRLLKSVFDSAPVPDNGFSKRIVFRIRRRIWINRLALPVAALVGAAFALKPAAQLIVALLPLLDVLSMDIAGASIQALPQLPTIALGGMMFAAGATLFKILEET